MPGIFGILSNNDDSSLMPVMHSMQTFLMHRNTFSSDVIFHDEKVYAGRCHPGIIGQAPQPANNEDIFVWLDGEFYNQEEFPVAGNQMQSDALQLVKNYQADPSLGFMNRIDGVFSAVIYDRPRKKLSMCADRYGFQHLYWIKYKEHFAWATEYKAFLALPGFGPKIDRDTLQSFLSHGYIPGNRTWFNNVSLVPPATVISCDVQSGEIASSRYWDWRAIKFIQENVDHKEIAEEWGRRFCIAVNVRSKPYDKTGIALSGGLDSRAILAAMPQKGQPITAYSFGQKGCDDVRIAQKAARLKGAAHIVYEIDTPLWLQANLAAVWSTDGEVCVLDANGCEFLDSLSHSVSITLNGMGGDPIHGGTLLDKKDDHTFPLQDRYEDEDRRWIRPGFRLVESFCQVRMPFYANSLVELMLSIPDNMRKDSYLYKKILLHNFPDYFKTIPWQKSGVPISLPHMAIKAFSFFRRVESKVCRLAYQYGIPIRDTIHTINRRQRTVTLPGKPFLSNLFNSQNALYPEYLPKEQVLAAWNRHITGKDATTMINRYATLEIWLQQVFAKTLRPQPETFPFVEIP